MPELKHKVLAPDKYDVPVPAEYYVPGRRGSNQMRQTFDVPPKGHKGEPKLNADDIENIMIALDYLGVDFKAGAGAEMLMVSWRKGNDWSYPIDLSDWVSMGPKHYEMLIFEIYAKFHFEPSVEKLRRVIKRMAFINAHTRDSIMLELEEEEREEEEAMEAMEANI